MKLLLLVFFLIPCALNSQVKIFGKHPKVSTTNEMQTIAGELPWDAFITKGTDSSNKGSDHFNSNAFDLRMVGNRGLFKIRNGRLLPKSALRKLNRAAKTGEFDEWKDKYGVKVILIEIPTKSLKYGKFTLTPAMIEKDLKHYLDISLHQYIFFNENATGIHFHIGKWDPFESKEVLLHEGEVEFEVEEVEEPPSMILNRTHSTPSDDPSFASDIFDEPVKPVKPTVKPVKPVTPTIKEIVEKKKEIALPPKDTSFVIDTMVGEDSVAYSATVWVDWTAAYEAPKPISKTIKEASLWNICLDFVAKRTIKFYGEDELLLKSKRSGWISNAMTGYQNKALDRHKALAAITFATTITNTDILNEVQSFLRYGLNGDRVKELMSEHADFGKQFYLDMFDGRAQTEREEQRLLDKAKLTFR